MRGRLYDSLYFRILRSIEKEPKSFDQIFEEIGIVKAGRFGKALNSLVKAGCIERLDSGLYVLLSTGHRMLNYYYSQLEMLLIEAKGKGIIVPLVKGNEEGENSRSRRRN
ncbi:MAG: hypothetical protein QXU45_06120 [Candidatus Bathyarchaeia archaeon]